MERVGEWSNGDGRRSRKTKEAPPARSGRFFTTLPREGSGPGGQDKLAADKLSRLAPSRLCGLVGHNGGFGSNAGKGDPAWPPATCWAAPPLLSV